MDEPTHNFLSEDECHKLVEAAVAGSEDMISDEEMETILQWAVATAIAHSPFEQALAGLVALSVIDGEVNFSLTSYGADIAEEIIVDNFKTEMDDEL